MSDSRPLWAAVPGAARYNHQLSGAINNKPLQCSNGQEQPRRSAAAREEQGNRTQVRTQVTAPLSRLRLDDRRRGTAHRGLGVPLLCKGQIGTAHEGVRGTGYAAHVQEMTRLASGLPPPSLHLAQAGRAGPSKRPSASTRHTFGTALVSQTRYRASADGDAQPEDSDTPHCSNLKNCVLARICIGCALARCISRQPRRACCDSDAVASALRRPRQLHPHPALCSWRRRYTALHGLPRLPSWSKSPYNKLQQFILRRPPPPCN